tara:strand:- start:319 stop:2214 length:1896 start_codon:yes stop_codon:yes gene_type:complete
MTKNSSSNVNTKEQATPEPLTRSAQFDLFAQTESSEKKEINISNFKFHENLKDMQKLISKIEISKEFSFQLITDKNNTLTPNLVGVAISFLNNNGCYLEFNVTNKSVIKDLFENDKTRVIGFNLKSSIKILLAHNIQIKGPLFDVQIAHYLLHPDMRNSLDIISENYLNVLLEDEKTILGKSSAKVLFSDLNQSSIISYACTRSLSIFDLSKILKKEIQKNNLSELFEKMELPLSKVLAKMELEGITLDLRQLKALSIELTKKLALISSKIYEFSEEKFNISSPKQMGEILFEKMKLSKKPKKTRSGQYSTSEETLLKLQNEHPIIKEILSFRGIKKLLSTYVDALPHLINPETQKIHTTFNQSVASTGRLSSTNPNIQNIPIRTEMGMKVRKAFIPRNNKFILMSADYSQIELRIMASLSRDQEMLAAFNKGLDIHSATAAKVYKVPLDKVDRIMRSNAKSVNFGIIYGISAFGLSQNINVSRKEAQEIITNYFEEFPRIKQYMDLSIKKAREKKYVETIMGRRRYLKDINASNGMIRAMAERNAINAPIQGTAADIIKIAMIQVDREMTKREMRSKMLLQVHDELIFDMHESEKEELKTLVKEKMENAIRLEVPLIVDIGEGDSWLKAH